MWKPTLTVEFPCLRAALGHQDSLLQSLLALHILHLNHDVYTHIKTYTMIFKTCLLELFLVNMS